MMKPVLVTPDLDKEMRVEVDASDFATGGVLLMKCEDKSVKIVDGGLYFSLFTLFSFLFLLFYFYFSIFRTTWVRVYQSHCHITHKLMAKSQDR